MYDTVLRIPLPEGARSVGFADDVGVITVGKYLREITQISNDAVRLIRQWLSTADLQLADHKKEAVLLCCRKKRENITFSVENCKIVL